MVAIEGRSWILLDDSYGTDRTLRNLLSLRSLISEFSVSISSFSGPSECARVPCSQRVPCNNHWRLSLRRQSRWSCSRSPFVLVTNLVLKNWYRPFLQILNWTACPFNCLFAPCPTILRQICNRHLDILHFATTEFHDGWIISNYRVFCARHPCYHLFSAQYQ